MKKRAGIIIAACVLVSFAVGAALLMGGGKKPYKGFGRIPDQGGCTGYRTKYEPCEALSQYANSLLSK